MYALAAKLICMLYALCARLPLQKKITLLSRQGKKGSLDLKLLKVALEAKYPGVKIQTCTTDPEIVSKRAFVASLPRMVYHVATSRVCVLEGYIPAVSIPSLRRGTTVIQMWHALGAIKKFGYQSVGAKAGRSIEAAQALSMHKNYDWIVAAGRGATSHYAEAFGYDESRIVALGLPRMDYLLSESPNSARMKKLEELKDSHNFLASGMNILYAPTLRKGDTRTGWMSREVEKLAHAFEPYGLTLVVAGHPLDATGSDGRCAPSNVEYIPGAKSMDIAGLCDCVITDYSAVAFEAALIGKPVWFYVPDIEEYRVSTGLNIDPLEQFPGISDVHAGRLVEKIVKRLAPIGESEEMTACDILENEFIRYSQDYFEGISRGATSRLADFVGECYSNTLQALKG